MTQAMKEGKSLTGIPAACALTLRFLSAVRSTTTHITLVLWVLALLVRALTLLQLARMKSSFVVCSVSAW